MPPCVTLSIIRYGSRVKWSNPGKGVAPSPTPWCSSYRKGTLGSPSTMVNAITTVNPRSRCFGKERKNILRHNLFGDKIIQNCLKIDATHMHNELLLRQETQKRFPCPES